jgi:hypothetical protein
VISTPRINVPRPQVFRAFVMRHVAENPPRWVRPTSIVAGLPPAPVSRLSHRRGHLRAGHDHMTSPNPRCRFLTQCHTYLGVTPSTGVLRLRACSFVPSTTCAKWLSQTMASAQALGWLAPRQREQTGSEPRPAPEIVAPATSVPWDATGATNRSVAQRHRSSMDLAGTGFFQCLGTSSTPYRRAMNLSRRTSPPPCRIIQRFHRSRIPTRI